MTNWHTVTLSIGGIAVSIESQKKLFVDLIKFGFGGFVATGKRSDLKIRAMIDDSRDTNTYSYGRPHQTSVIFDSGKFFARGSGYSGVFDLDTLKGEVRLSVAVAPLYLFLRFVFSVYLPYRDGFVLHSNSILRNDRCFLFSGKPQSGKSTVAKLSSNHEVLSDDFSIVRKMNGSFCAYGSPFWGHVEAKGGNIRNRLGCAKVSGIYFLYKDTNVCVEKLERKGAVAQILQNMAILAKDRNTNTRLIRLADEFACAVNCGVLHFRLDNSFWRCIEND